MNSMNHDQDIYTSIDALRRLQFKARGFSLVAQQPINSILSGKNASKLRGRGLNFEEMRQYQVGDDIRTMDWKVTMRTKKPHVKVYSEERERNVILLVDQRQSMFFGSKGKTKSVIAAEIAALMAWQVVASTDRIGAVVFNDNQVTHIAPKRSQNQVITVIGDICRYNHKLTSGASQPEHHVSLESMFAQVMRIIGHDALLIMISDGYGWSDKCGEYVKRISQHNDIMLCHVTDPLERQLIAMSQMVVSDGDMQIELTTKKEALQQRFSHDVENAIAKFLSVAHKYRMPMIAFDTLLPTDKQVRKAFGVVRA
ncbi:DUF58 domain-containing protein [Thalassotalea sp. HSM 43]|uniref:DUF58 domain-containing protein n=1 Tax=Thalassotalea sp. HSM 43 TaxID=2552945 RepID=UPI0010815396|nr:DUF58 domain-containing protein [Thalassotalea sp. HSM 43]QBY02915.1 DUF58 domain-containing protein [Thalassotalea sp. HSM 43]